MTSISVRIKFATFMLIGMAAVVTSLFGSETAAAATITDSAALLVVDRAGGSVPLIGDTQDAIVWTYPR